MGGRLALQYALRYPERIEQLILASTHLGLTSEEERQKRLQSDAEWAKRLVEWPIDEFLKHWYDQPIFANYRPDFSMRRKHNVQSLAASLLHYSLGRQPVLDTRLFGPRVVHVVGEKDQKFRLLYPEATVIPGAGHAVHLEKPESFARIIKECI